MLPSLLFTALLSTPALTLDTPRLELEISIDDPKTERVEVTARLANLDGPLTLRLPEDFAYVILEPDFVEGPAIHGAAPAGSSLEAGGPFHWLLDPGGARELELRWTMRLDQRRHPRIVGRDEFEHPYLDSDHGMLVTGALLLVPEKGQCTGVRFELPEGWGVEAPWPEREPGLFVPPTLDALRNDLIAVGHWDTHRETVAGVDLTVAFAPGQDRLQAGLGERLARIVEAELGLFGSVPNERYLFLFGRPDQPGTYAGSPKSTSMTLVVSPDLPVDFAKQGVEHLIAHEYHHTWKMARCNPLPELRFVMEGFTDWYAHVVPWRLGWKSDAAFQQTLCAEISKAEGALAAFDGSLTDAGGTAFFGGGPPYQACYSGGFALAAWTELALIESEAEIDLDELLRRFYEDPRWRDGTSPTLDDWYALLGEHLDGAFVETQRFVLETDEEIEWVPLFAEVGLELDRVQVPCAPTPRANFEGAAFTTIDRDGAAGRLGLRRGDRLLEINGQAVSDLSTIRAAWGPDDGGRIALVYERDGEELALDTPYPSRVTYRPSSGAWWPWEG